MEREPEYFAVKVIAKIIFCVQCDPDGNPFLIFEDAVDCKPEGHYLTIAEQHILVNGRKLPRKKTKE
jgi:hypothetical protein